MGTTLVTQSTSVLLVVTVMLLHISIGCRGQTPVRAAATTAMETSSTTSGVLNMMSLKGTNLPCAPPCTDATTTNQRQAGAPATEVAARQMLFMKTQTCSALKTGALSTQIDHL